MIEELTQRSETNTTMIKELWKSRLTGSIDLGCVNL